MATEEKITKEELEILKRLYPQIWAKYRIIKIDNLLKEETKKATK